MRKYLFFSLFFFNACNETAFSIDNKKNQLQEIEFDVVEKKLIIAEDIPENIKNSLNLWFNNKVKVNGFSGNMTLDIYNYEQEIINIIDGKRIETSLNLYCLKRKQ